MSVDDFMNAAVLALFPGARPGLDFAWSIPEGGTKPAMVSWNSERLGAYNDAAVKAKASQLMSSVHVPTSVSNSDFRAAMLMTDGDAFQALNAEILSWENDPSLEKRILRQRWEYANVFMRSMLHGAAPLLGRTEQEIDQLLVLAESLNN